MLQIVCTIVIELERVRSKFIGMEILNHKKAKVMFIIIWNPSGFDVVNRLPSDTKMKSAYFLTKIPIPLEEAIFPRGRTPYTK
jgi:hypothetical protein